MHGQQNIKFTVTHLPGLRFGGLTCVRVTHDAIKKFSSSECRPAFRIIITQNESKFILYGNGNICNFTHSPVKWKEPVTHT